MLIDWGTINMGKGDVYPSFEEPPGSGDPVRATEAPYTADYTTEAALDAVYSADSFSAPALLPSFTKAPRTPRVGRAAPAPAFLSAPQFVADVRPSEPVHLLRPHVLRGAAQWFISHFPGQVLYAVKANPSPAVIKQLWASGIRHFDVASLAEVELVAGLFPKAKLHFMHPVKSREAIRKSYFQHGVRDFVVDSAAELFKLLEETRGARDLGIIVRIAVAGGYAFHSLAGKFGADARQAVELLKQARKVAPRLGLAFHVGQQTMNPASYRHALAHVGEIIRAAKINPDIIDVGGGFPVSFPGLVPPDMNGYMEAIREGFEALKLPKKTKLWCEPGRALVQEAGSLITKVELRKDNRLYINDGFYGALFDAGISRLAFPVRLIRPDGAVATKLGKFHVYGPTCDSLDVLKTPLHLPVDVEEGDWLEFGNTGGYGVALQSRFNGFGASEEAVEVADAPLLKTPGYWQDAPPSPDATLVSF